MPMQITSTTDSKETLDALASDKGETTEVEETQETKSASEESSTEETAEASDTSESDETEKEGEDSKGEESDEDDESSEEEEPKEKAPKRKNGFKRRIDKLRSRASAAEEERDYWKQQALKTQKPEAAKDPADGKVKSNEGRPSKDDFDSHEDYIEALVDWKADQKNKDQETKSTKQRLDEEHEKAVDLHKARIKAFAETVDDFEEVVNSVADIRLSPTFSEEIINSENGPQLVYELSKDPEELERICSLPHSQAIRAIGRFEAKLEKKSKTSSENNDSKKTTKAPPPVNPVGPSKTGSGKKSIYDPNLSQKEFELLRKEQLAQKRA